jgi:hypothetical protein
VRNRDPKAEIQVEVAAVFESKSRSNVLDVMFERQEGARVASSGQFGRDIERFSETDLIISIERPDGSVTQLRVPAGRAKISRTNTQFVLVTPKPALKKWRPQLEEIGIKASNSAEWAPTFPRGEIDDWVERLLVWAVKRKK